MWARGVAVLNMCVCLVGCTTDPPSSGIDGGAAVADVGAPADGASPIDGADPGGAFGAPGSLEAIGAAGAVGLAWEPVVGATGYVAYWSTAPGVSPADGNRIADVTPGYIHGGRVDGTEYFYVVTAIGPEGESAPSPEASATAGGLYELFHLGTGAIRDFRDGSPMRLPIERRVHLTIMAEGYLATELDTFRMDVDGWMDDVLTADPYSHFTEALVVWALPTPSAEHIAPTAPQTADTAFRVPITADGDQVSSTFPNDGPTASRLWAALEEFPYPPTNYFGPYGRLSRVARTVVPHVLVVDPSTGRSGLSGRVQRIIDPADDGQRLNPAFGRPNLHEFSHAFANMHDEYLSSSRTGYGVDVADAGESGWISNVVDDPSCSTLPWRHLLVGTPINPDVDGLIGAFGDADNGYHSELSCQMNGRSDNAATYGGDGYLKVDRFCNFCRELIVFRLMERVGILADDDTSVPTWAASYREPFYDAFGFLVPDQVPQRSSDGTEWFSACTP